MKNRLHDSSFTNQAGKVGVEGEKTPAPPSELKWRTVEGHVGTRIEAYSSTINVTEAIFECPLYT